MKIERERERDIGGQVPEREDIEYLFQPQLEQHCSWLNRSRSITCGYQIVLLLEDICLADVETLIQQMYHIMH